MAGRYHVRVGGQGYLLKPGSYRRSSAGAWPAGTPASTRSGEWLRWQQSDWQQGDGGQGSGARGLGTETRWARGYGVEIGEPGRVRLGTVMLPGYVSDIEDGFAAMLALGGKLFAASSSSGKLYQYDGLTWSLSVDTGKSSLRCLARHGSKLYLGSGSDGAVWCSDGGSWAEAFAVAAASAIGCMVSYGVWNSTAKATVRRLFVGAEYSSGEAKLFCWDGASLDEVQECGEARVEAMAVYDGKLYVATSDAGNGIAGRLLCFDGRGASGEWSEVACFSDNYVAGMAVFDNLLFCGSGTGGKLWAFDGGRMVEAYSTGSSRVSYAQPLRALAVQGGRLYVGYVHSTEGAALLCKLPVQVLGVGGWVLEGSSTQHLIPNTQLGWFTPCTVDPTGAPSALSVYGGDLYLGCERPGSGAIYRRNGSAYRLHGQMETSFVDSGQPGVSKLLRSLTLEHEKLLAGQYLEAHFALEGTDSFQRIEEFDSLAGCDRSLTTADWRVADSLVRLKGMPWQGFTGKTRGKTTVPHIARKLITAAPISPPATFVDELEDAEYEAISGSGGGMAVFSNPVDGGRVHLLFEFDLARLNPAGLRPRTICYGNGEAWTVPAPGVQLMIWNHAEGRWDPVGSNSARSGDSEEARTIAPVVSDCRPYVGQSGKVYLALSSSHAGSPANPAEIGVDLVELAPLWQESVEVVSEPLRLPVARDVSSATLALLSAITTPGTSVELYMSADDGAHWEAVTDGVEHIFAHPGSSLRWKARLAGNGLSTPSIDRLKVDYFAGSWMLLGRSDTEGSTSAELTFGSGVVAGRVAFRIDLASSDSATSPALTGLTLRYGVKPEARRRWEADLLCEGVPGAPLRLLDGSTEVRSGKDLSQALWQAKARGAVAFEDVDGESYEVWFEDLEEKLSEASQGRGGQTVAKCRFIEC